MGVFDEGYTQAVIDAEKNPVERPPAGYIDAYIASWDAFRQENLSISEDLNLARKRGERRELIQELTGEDISALEGQALSQLSLQPLGRSREGEAFVGRYQEKMRDLTSRYSQIKTDGDLTVEIVEDSRRIRERSEKVLGNTTFGGKIGSFVGAMSAAMTDPLVVATIPFGASASAGILRGALADAGIGALSEALIQPMVYRYKKKLESPYSVEEALGNVAMVGAGSAVLGGAVRGAAKGLARLKGFDRLTPGKPRIEGVDDLLGAFDEHVARERAAGREPTTEQLAAREVLHDYADTLRENPFELGNPITDETHLQASAKALADVEAGRPVEVRDIVGGLEPREEIRGERVKIVQVPKAPAPATENQSVGQFVKNSGGVSVDRAGALRGEYDALYEGGGRKAGIVKKKAGLSADEMAERAQEAGFIDEPDPALLAEALDRDLRGDKVYSAQGSRFERKMELSVERVTSDAEWQRWALAKEPEYLTEIEGRARAILDEADVEISLVARAEGGELAPVAGREAAEVMERKEGVVINRSAREFIKETEEEANMGALLRKCLMGGGE